jgi:predicted transcriptional regulator
LRARLLPLGHSQLQKLALDSGVPFTTLWKIRSGETRNPGIDTARRFYPLVSAQEAKSAA